MPDLVLPRLGKRPATAPRVRSLRHLFGDALFPAVPSHTNRTRLVTDWGMLGNDQYGDCVEAAGCHAVDLLTAAAGKPRRATTADAFGIYERFGFDPKAGPPGANPTDNGTNVQDFIQGWATDGYTIAGQLDKIDGFASLTPTNLAEIREAIAWLGVVIVGLALPLAYQQMAAPGVPFDLPAGQSLSGDWAYGSAGGHGVPITDYQPGWFTIITWGGPKQMSEAFWHAYADESYAILDRDFASPNLPQQVWSTLEQEMADLRAREG